MTVEEKRKAGNVKEIVLYSQQETEYTQVSNTPGQMCQNCRWFRGYTCSIVNDYAPKSIVPTGWCNQWEAEPAEQHIPVQAVVVVPEVEGGMVAMMPTGMGHRSLPEGDGGGEYVRTPPMNIIVKGKTVPATPKQTLLRDKAGRRYMFIVTSNGYKDREDEWIPAAELKSYVENCWLDEKTFHSDNDLLFWHHPALKAGSIVWADMEGPFLIELAREGDSPIAKALWDYREANPNDELWGASHGFRYQQRSAEGVYAGIRKKETSFLPLLAAANSLTASEVLTVMKSRDEYVNNLFKTFGVDGAADMLRAGPQQLADALSRAGVNAKSTDAAATPAGTSAPHFTPEASKMITEMIEMQADLMTRMEAVETKAKDAPALPPELTTTLTNMGAAIRQIQATLELQPTQASKDTGTVVDPGTDATAQKAAEELAKKEQGGTYDPFYGDMKVPINP